MCACACVCVWEVFFFLYVNVAYAVAYATNIVDIPAFQSERDARERLCVCVRVCVDVCGCVCMCVWSVLYAEQNAMMHYLLHVQSGFGSLMQYKMQFTLSDLLQLLNVGRAYTIIEIKLRILCVATATNTDKPHVVSILLYDDTACGFEN